MKRRVLAAVAATAVVTLLAGCASAEGWSTMRPAPEAVGTPAPGFSPDTAPAPESTLAPAPGSWNSVSAPAGYRVVLLTVGDDAPTATLVAAVQDWAEETHADLRVVHADDDMIDGAVRAMELNPDLIISAGDALVDPLATVTANHLDRQFLIVGAELAEPTENVTAADWTGAAYRGEDLGTAAAYDPATFTPERAGAAVRAGVAAVLTGLRGVVLWID
ncbi:hypothetical protein Q9R20_05660 [Microbacterium sp. PRF11]|uniref:hypothetical protein n=1 Tax=Microbacterium sp. PRF11 TaxID=2962593 RepID=UPI0028820143|nr:hypothetical protein [Microbacterium sp. PRF11]MDT0116473.1 hypothetical protein [Microbacterium sp. PRF11]